MGLFDAALGIGGGVVHLGHVLASHSADIGDLHLHDDVPAAIHKALDGLGKGGVGKAIAEGILDGAFIVDEPVSSRRFIIAVAHIDALGVFHVIAFQVAVGEAARVVIGGRSGQVISVNIGEPPGGVHFAGQRLPYRVEAHRAGAADPECCVHTLHEAQLHGVGGVDEHDHLVIVLPLDDVQEGFFIPGQL